MFPITIKTSLNGRNATNIPGLILLDPSAEERAAVFAQELYESRMKMNPATAIGIALSKKRRRDMELMGHEVEVQAAVMFYGAAEAQRRYREALSMWKGYDGLFKGMTIDQIIAAMRKRRDTALRFVLDNRRAIERHL